MQQNFGKRLYIRIDGRGNAIAGTDLWLKKVPSSGRWQDITPDGCCTGPTVEYTPPDVSLTGFTLTIACDAVDKITRIFTETSTDIYSLTTLLNDGASFIGVFDTDGTVLSLRLKSSVVHDMCPDGTITFTVA